MILLAKRCESKPWPRPYGSSQAQKLGLRYERSVFRQLVKQYGPSMVEHNPWYNYEDETGFHACCPDIIIWGQIPIILEVKYTITPTAFGKMALVYQPVVGKATRTKPRGLVIAKNVLPGFQHSPNLFVQWLGRGPIEIPGTEGK